MAVAVSNKGKEMSPDQEMYYRLLSDELDLSGLVDALYDSASKLVETESKEQNLAGKLGATVLSTKFKVVTSDGEVRVTSFGALGRTSQLGQFEVHYAPNWNAAMGADGMQIFVRVRPVLQISYRVRHGDVDIVQSLKLISNMVGDFQRPDGDSIRNLMITVLSAAVGSGL